MVSCVSVVNMTGPSLSRRLLSLLFVALIFASVAVPTTAAAPVATEISLDSVERAFDLLMDRYVHPLDSAMLLTAGWQGAVQATATADQPVPALSGDRDADWASFAAALEALSASSGVDGEVLKGAVIRAMAASVNEGHTYYLDQQAYRDYLDWIGGDVQYAGIGIRIDRETLVLLEVFENSPAAQSGLLAGDTLIAVNDVSVVGQDQNQVIDTIRGEAGTSVSISVTRAGVEEPLTFTMTRAQIMIAFVRSSLLPSGVGYLHLRGFADHDVANEFEAALDSLIQQGATSLVIDLRGNSGGRVDVGSRLLSLFIEDGALYHRVGRSGSPAVAMVEPGRYRTPPLPLVVLVDGGSASMAEIFAAAIQDHGRGTVIGTTTAGSVAAAQVYGLPDGSAIQVTVMEITSANGRALNTIGVAPDQVVELDLSALQQGRDVQLEAAVATLQPPSPSATTISALLALAN